MMSIMLCKLLFTACFLFVAAAEQSSCVNNESESCVVNKEAETLATRDSELKDHNETCHDWANRGECEINPDYMLHYCAKSCQTFRNKEPPETAFGVKQIIQGGNAELVRQTISAAIDYMNDVVWANPDKFPEKIANNCRNQEDLCAEWAATGECEKNPAYMKINCAPVCHTCEELDYNVRCPRDPNATNALQPGDLHRMFERIVQDESIAQRFNVTIHSRPYIEGHEGIYGRPLAEGQIDGPWVVTFENFLSEEEANRMIELGFEEGYERSTDIGGYKFDGTIEPMVKEGRTSTNAWCGDECNTDPVTKLISERIEQVTGIPETNSEHLQILRYEEGQFYNFHHDLIETDFDRPTGARILTFFMYLSNVEEGGGTRFPQLGESPGLTVLPQKGKALLWPSVMDHDPLVWDPRTHHAALPVVMGIKYACNSWIHMRDFKTQHDKGCS